MDRISTLGWIASFALALSLTLAPALALADHHKGAAGKGARAEKLKGMEASEDRARGAEMRERRDERKDIQEAYQERVESGEERVEGKKPWWKFWGTSDKKE